MPPARDTPVYEYTLGPLFPDRLGLRWRWTLSYDGLLLAAGWRHGERQALTALRRAAARAAHAQAGSAAYVLRPRELLVPAA